MTPPLRLHYAPDNASLCVRLALDHLDLPFETVLVDRGARAQRSAAYLALNPNGLIPVLETPEGPMFETGAILLWLADQNGGLMADPRGAGRAHDVQWLVWLANTLHPALRILFYPDKHVDGDVGPLHKKTQRRVAEMLRVMNDAARAPWLEADGPTAQGCYLAPMLRWLALYGAPNDWFALSDYPRLLTFARRADLWACTAKAQAAEGLGPTPFSAPSSPNPPEGRAI